MITLVRPLDDSVLELQRLLFDDEDSLRISENYETKSLLIQTVFCYVVVEFELRMVKLIRICD